VREDRMMQTASQVELLVNRFHSIFHHRYWRAKRSRDIDIDQSAGSMLM